MSEPAMSGKSSDDARFVTLETKIAYQEKLLADLNEMLLKRGDEVDALLRRVGQLERLLRDGGPEEPSNDPPPHY